MESLASFSDLSKTIQKALEKKAKDHNEKVGDDKRKRTTKATLGKVFLRGIGAYNENPSSVRPQVSSAEQWAYARVNSFLYVLRNLKFRGGKHDTDLLPKSHPLSSKKRTDTLDLEYRNVASYKSSLPRAPLDTPWGWENGEKEKVLEKGWDTFKRAHLWFDPSKKESLSSYRLPIAKLIDGELKVVFRGVAAAVGALNGNKKQSIQGITSEERERIYKVLEKYYESFREKIPPLRVLDTSISDIFVDKIPDDKEEKRSNYCEVCECIPCDCGWGSYMFNKSFFNYKDSNDSAFGVFREINKVDSNTKEKLEEDVPEYLQSDIPIKDYPNDSETKKELEQIILSMNKGKMSKTFIKKADEDITSLFMDLIKDKTSNLNYLEIENLINNKLEDLSIFIIQLKYSYNRPRPYQVAKILGIQFDRYNSVSADTPAYPSGHTIQSRYMAHYLSKEFPHLKDDFISLSDNISMSRFYAGLHYLSDISYGESVADALYENSDLEFVDEVKRAVGDTDPTNFPKSGDNKKVSLRNSKYPLFPRDFAERIRTEYPSIWKKGGNIKGNDQYQILTKIQKENNGSPKTPSQEKAIRLREAWMARHLKDFRIAGVIAQIKWLGISSKGLQYMKNLVKEEIDKVNKKKKRSKDMSKEIFTFQSLEEKEDGTKEYRYSMSENINFQLRSNEMQDKGSESEDQSSINFFTVEGIASSTSIDSYGTEMSLMGLESMKKQMDRGIPILPRHNSATAGGVAEWDEVIGRTFSSDIEASKVVAASDNNSRQYTLRLRSQLYKDNKLSQELMKRINRGEPIGQSIGGWFDEVRVLENREGEIERVIVDKVTLDHVAITRAPANPDSKNLFQLRTKIVQAINNSKNSKNMESRMIIKDNLSSRMKEFTEEEKMKFEEEKMKFEEEKMKFEEEKMKFEEEKTKFKEKMTSEKEMMEEKMTSEKEMMEEKTEEEKTKLEERGVVPFSEMPTSEIDWVWDTEAQDEILGEDNNWDMYRRAHLFVDGDGESKSDYKLPVAKMVAGTLTLIYKGLVSAMASLNGARGGVNLSEEDRKSVYETIKRYYSLFDREPPELMGYKEKMEEEKMEEFTEEEKMEQYAEKESEKSKISTTEERTNLQNVDQNLDNSDITIQNTIEHREETMNEKDIEKLGELISRSLAPITERLEVLETRTEVKEVSEVDRLKAELARTEAQIQRMISAPVRQGIKYKIARGGEEARTVFSSMIEDAESVGVAQYTTEVIKRNQDKVCDKNTTANELVDMLAETLRAADVDGLLN